ILPLCAASLVTGIHGAAPGTARGRFAIAFGLPEREGLACKWLCRGASGAMDGGREPTWIRGAGVSLRPRIHGVPAAKPFACEARSAKRRRALQRYFTTRNCGRLG